METLETRLEYLEQRVVTARAILPPDQFREVQRALFSEQIRQVVIIWGMTLDSVPTPELKAELEEVFQWIEEYLKRVADSDV